jgi:hypothetical protein
MKESGLNVHWKADHLNLRAIFSRLSRISLLILLLAGY